MKYKRWQNHHVILWEIILREIQKASNYSNPLIESTILGGWGFTYKYFTSTAFRKPIPCLRVSHAATFSLLPNARIIWNEHRVLGKHIRIAHQMPDSLPEDNRCHCWSCYSMLTFLEITLSVWAEDGCSNLHPLEHRFKVYKRLCVWTGSPPPCIFSVHQHLSEGYDHHTQWW